MMERKLKGHDYMQAHIEFNNDDTQEVLISYTTGVVFKFVGRAIEKELGHTPLNAKEAYWISGLYSNTTIKHISLYCRENNISYYDLRLIVRTTNWYLLVLPDQNPYVRYYYNRNSGEILEVKINQKESYYKKIRKYIGDND